MTHDATMVSFQLTQGLQTAFGSMIMPSIGYGRALVVSKPATETLTAEEKGAVLDPFSSPEAFKSLWVKGAALAQRTAVEENDRLGLDSHGTVGGRLAVKSPTGEIKIVKRFDI